MTDASGNVTSSETYDDSIGNASGNLATRYRFTGHRGTMISPGFITIGPLGDGDLGRFVSEDPIGFAGGDVNLTGMSATGRWGRLILLDCRKGPVNYSQKSCLSNTEINGVSNTVSDLLM
ncbi:MAG: hypothetical protein IPJ30_06740 [Acidobacteria bacterium]|nr:hypothetical protein [Acidobacteriota bacterium]